MIVTLHIDDLDGAVTLFKSTDEGTETIAVFDEEHHEVLKDILRVNKRLREELDEAQRERNKYDGALNIALEHLGYQGADHDWFCKEKYQCNVYGDDLEDEEE